MNQVRPLRRAVAETRGRSLDCTGAAHGVRAPIRVAGRGIAIALAAAGCLRALPAGPADHPGDDAGGDRRRLGLRALGRDPAQGRAGPHPRPVGGDAGLAGALGRALRRSSSARPSGRCASRPCPVRDRRAGLLRLLPATRRRSRAQRAGDGALPLQPAPLLDQLLLHERRASSSRC